MTYRILPSAEWPRLETEFSAHGVPLPDPRLARVAVAEDGDAIVGFLVLQWVPHMEPLWIQPAYRGKAHWPSLLHTLEAELGDGEFFVFAPNDQIAGLARAAGCQQRDWRIFTKESRA